MFKFFDGQTDGRTDSQSDYYRAPATPTKAILILDWYILKSPIILLFWNNNYIIE